MRYPEGVEFYVAVAGVIWILDGLFRLGKALAWSKRSKEVNADIEEAGRRTDGFIRLPNSVFATYGYNYSGRRYQSSMLWISDFAMLGIPRVSAEYAFDLLRVFKQDRYITIKVDPYNPERAYHVDRIWWPGVLMFVALGIGAAAVIVIQFEQHSMFQIALAIFFGIVSRYGFIKRFAGGYR